MNLAVLVILVLSVLTLSNFGSATYMYDSENLESMRCRFSQPAANTNNCAMGWYKNQCKIKVCLKGLGEICGSATNLDRQLRYGMCAPTLTCCHNVCMERCYMPLEDHTKDITKFLIENVKRNSGVTISKIPSERQLDDEEY